jgi:hypothetical protein
VGIDCIFLAQDRNHDRHNVVVVVVVLAVEVEVVEVGAAAAAAASQTMALLTSYAHYSSKTCYQIFVIVIWVATFHILKLTAVLI